MFSSGENRKRADRNQELKEKKKKERIKTSVNRDDDVRMVRLAQQQKAIIT